MGMWVELGIFGVVLAWCFWQLYDVKQAKAQRIAEEVRQAKLAGEKVEESGKAKGSADGAVKENAEGPAVPPA